MRERRPTLLKCNGVAQIVVHLREHIYSVRVERKMYVFQEAQSMKLMSKCGFAQNKLRSIRTIETVDTVEPHNTILQEDRVAGRPVRALQARRQGS